jgi:hypothetical protein
MRYKTLEEVAGKYGLTVDLDEKAQFAEWESRLKKLLEAKQKELPNARNPSLRHKVERECAEVQEACKFVSQQNFFTKLRRCVDEDKQEIFEHELRKPESRAILPAEDDAQYEQFLELKVAARKKWSNGAAQAAGAAPSPVTFSPSDGAREDTAPAISNSVLDPAARPMVSAIEPGRGSSGVGIPVVRSAEPSIPGRVGASELIAADMVAVSRPEPATMGGRNSVVPSDFGASKLAPLADEQPGQTEEKMLPAVVEPALPSVTLATATGTSTENVTVQGATTGSQPAALTPVASGQSVETQQTETRTSNSGARRQLPKIPIKREHVSTALDVLVKIRALTGLGGSFTTLRIVGTALAVFLIALAGLITQLTRERSRQNERADNTPNAPAHQESQVSPAAPPSSPEPSKQPSEFATASSEPKAPSDNAKQDTAAATQSSDIPKPLSEISNQSAEPAKQSSDLANQASETEIQPSHSAGQPVEPAKKSAELPKQASETAKQPAESANQTSQPAKPGEVVKQPTEAPKPSGEVVTQSAEPPKQASEIAKSSTEPPKTSSDIPQPHPEVAKSFSSISELTKAPVEASTPPVSIAKQESQHPEPPAGTKTAPPPRPKIQLALLRIESTPPDAAISIRGTKQPLKTPAEFNLLPGDYDVALALDCFTSVGTTLHLDGGENRLLKRELQSLQPALTVRTVPSGARIYVDGALRNQLTPATLTGIDPGDRWVTVELAGFRSQNIAVKAKCGETVPVDFGVLQRPTTRVSITSNARGSSVWIDGADSGQTVPCSIELPLGTHRVRLVGPQGYRPEERSFYLQDEQSVRLDVPVSPELVAIPANNPSPSRPDPPVEYIPRANPNLLVWCGLDYSMVKMIGSPRDFPESEIFPNSMERRGDRSPSMTTAWNELFLREMYPRLGRDLRAIVQSDLRAVESRNARVSPQQIVNEESSPRNRPNIADMGSFFDPMRLLHRGSRDLPTHISDADIAAAIRSYRLQTRSGMGLVFVMDRLVKKQETSCLYVVFFDIASRAIISQERVCTEAGGGGIRNHWFGSIKETVKRLPEMYQDAKLKR